MHLDNVYECINLSLSTDSAINNELIRGRGTGIRNLMKYNFTKEAQCTL